MQSLTFSGAKLRTIRKAQRLTQGALARRINKQYRPGVSVASLSAYEKGNRSPSLDRYLAICEALGVKSDALVEDETLARITIAAEQPLAA